MHAFIAHAASHNRFTLAHIRGTSLSQLKLDRQLLSQGKFKTYDPLRQGKSMLLVCSALSAVRFRRHQKQEI